MVKVLIAGGGTGGHVYPMVAVADALQRERSDVEVVFVGTGRGIETRVIPAQGGRLELLEVLPLRGGGIGGAMRGMVAAMRAIPRARALVKQLAPDVVFSVGGYAAGPVTLAARSCGVPVTLLEPNAVLGFTNRVLKSLVQRAYICFPELKAAFRGEQARFTGVPLRSRFEPAPYPNQPLPEGMRLLIMGGSQGALALNETLPRAVAACLDAGLALQVVHQTGRDKDAAVRSLYEQLGIADRVVIKTFIDDVAAALAEADVVIERAGAGSLAELCAVGRGAILIPYPYAADDHQRRNAESLQAAGAAICVVQQDASVERLTQELVRLAGDSGLRMEMAAKAQQRGRPDAARAIARDLLALAEAAALAPGERPCAGGGGGRGGPPSSARNSYSEVGT